jgi:hypothetical protein
MLNKTQIIGTKYSQVEIQDVAFNDLSPSRITINGKDIETLKHSYPINNYE